MRGTPTAQKKAVVLSMINTAGTNDAPAGDPDALAPGVRAGPWVIEREIGCGGMGVVYGVVHESIGKRAALKVMHRRLACSAAVDRVVLEARVANQVGHPNVVDIFETGKLADGRPYIVMERLDGVTLAQRAAEGKILPDVVIAILLDVCDALVAAHAAGVIHRDLKLDNVFLLDNPDDPTRPRVKVLDWGIAKRITRDPGVKRATLDGQLVGTPQYLAPEQARGHEVSPKADVYSLGVMAYELLLEQLPFEAETSAEIVAMHLRAPVPPPNELWPDIPIELERLIVTMLAKDPDVRPTMLEVARALDRVRNELLRRCEAASQPRVIENTAPCERWRSAPGLASTELARVPSMRRWQYAIGALALATGAALVAFARDGEPTPAMPAAAAVKVVAPVVAARAAPPAPPPIIAHHVPATVVAKHVPPPTVVAKHVPPPAVVAKHVPPPAVVPPPPPPPRTKPHPIRKAPVAPHRVARFDPDGTVDPYR